ncbi:MAG: hypothetical protein JNK37_05280 [Verrucomicrobiales bacterium]|nr:hypothetical protein [Verrucomicrobiales bacterium]
MSDPAPAPAPGHSPIPTDTVFDPAPADLEDDFDDVELGERQAEACSMEEGCTTGCQ